LLCGTVLFVNPTSEAAESNDSTNRIEMLMSLKLEDLLHSEVTSVSKRPQEWFQTAAAVSVITGDDIRRSGAQSFPEALRLAPGVNVGQLNSSQWAVTIRGFNDLFSKNLLVLRDGRTLYSPLFNGVFWNVQDYLLEDIDRIEVIRGGLGIACGEIQSGAG
jgi:iron complex outermembrane receptor protein